MKIAELRAELEAGGVDVGKESRKSMVEGVKALREMQATESKGAPSEATPGATSHVPGSVYGPPKDAMGAAAAAELSGQPSPNPLHEMLSNMSQKAKATWKSLAGETAPQTAALNQDAANSIARAGVGLHAQEAIGPDLAAKVMGDKYQSEPFARKLGTLLAEEQLRGRRKAFLESGDAEAAGKVKSLVGVPGSIFPTESSFHAALNDPAIKDAIERHKSIVQPLAEQFHTRLGGETRAAGPNTGAFVNMEAIQNDPEGPARGQNTNPLNPLRKGSKFFKKFSGTADAYEVDYNRQVSRMMGNYAENSKWDMYDALKGGGLAREVEPGTLKEAPTINGRQAVRLPIERKPLGGQSRNADLWIDPRVFPEVQSALKMDPAKPQAAIVKVLNTYQLSAPTDAVFHLFNAGVALTDQMHGAGVLSQGLRRSAPVNIAENFGRVAKKLYDMAQDTPGVREGRAEITKVGAGRQGIPTPETELGRIVNAVNPLAYLGRAVHLGDEAVRLVLRDGYKEAVKNGLTTESEEGLRNAVNKMGQYNRNLMGPKQRAMRDVGLSPFVVAGRNFNRVTLGKLFQSAPYKAATPGARAQMVAATLSGTAATLGAVMLMNRSRTGHFAPAGVKAGALYVTTDDNGDVWSWDPFKITGERRGLRQIGADAAIEESRKPKSNKQQVVGRAAIQALSSQVHPWAGPAVSDIITATTGYDPTGHHVARDARKGESQPLLNAQAAAINANPVVGAAFERPYKGEEKKSRFIKYLESLGNAAGFYRTPAKLAREQNPL